MTDIELVKSKTQEEIKAELIKEFTENPDAFVRMSDLIVGAKLLDGNKIATLVKRDVSLDTLILATTKLYALVMLEFQQVHIAATMNRQKTGLSVAKPDFISGLRQQWDNMHKKN